MTYVWTNDTKQIVHRSKVSLIHFEACMTSYTVNERWIEDDGQTGVNESSIRVVNEESN